MGLPLVTVASRVGSFSVHASYTIHVYAQLHEWDKAKWKNKFLPKMESASEGANLSISQRALKCTFSSLDVTSANPIDP